MSFNVSPELFLALKGVHLIESDNPDEAETGAVALKYICDFVPGFAGDADVILEGARDLLPPDSDAHLVIIEAQKAILTGDLDEAIVHLCEAVTIARSEGAVITERLVCNVLSGPFPLAGAIKPLLPWEAAPTLN